MRRPGPGAGEPGGQPRSPSHRTNQACLSCRGQCGGDGVPRVGSGPHGPGKACPSLDRVQSPGLRGSELALHPGPGHTSSGPPGSQDRGQQSREGAVGQRPWGASSLFPRFTRDLRFLWLGGLLRPRTGGSL